MSIRLNRRKLLCVSFFLCCVLPTYFKWFERNEGTSAWTGLNLIGEVLFVGAMLFAFALFFSGFQFRLTLGILAHLIVLVAVLNSFFSFPLLVDISPQRNLALSLSDAQPAYWIDLILSVLHLAMFTTTEIAVRKLSEQTPPNPT